MVSLVVRRGRAAERSSERASERASGRGKHPNKEAQNNEQPRALAAPMRLLGLHESLEPLVLGSVFFRGAFLPSRSGCPPPARSLRNPERRESWVRSAGQGRVGCASVLLLAGRPVTQPFARRWGAISWTCGIFK